MINNLQIILPLLEFKEEGDFYQLYIFVRKKDMVTERNNHQSVRTIKSYTIRSIDYLLEKFDEIQLLCEIFKARAYINLNRLNDKDVGLKMIEKTVHCLQNKSDNLRKVYESVVGSLSSKEKRWIVDIDQEEIKDLDTYIIIINSCQPNNKEKILAKIPTKSGLHLITNPYNIEEFNIKCDDLFINRLDIHKMNPTVLYIPKALFTNYSILDVIKKYENIIKSFVGKDWKTWFEYSLFYQNKDENL